MKIPFKLPPIKNGNKEPEWSGNGFIIGNIKVPVLEYSHNFLGWSDDLNSLYNDDEIGLTHPISIASRANVISEIKKVILRTTSTSPTIMEIGCSSGFQLKEIHKQFKEAVVIGADVVKEPLYRLARTTPEIPLIRFDLLRCPLPQGCVDMLIMSNVLEHILEDTTALKNAFMLLKPGGSIIIEVPAYQFLYDAYDKAVCHFRRYSRPELQKKLQGVGFVINRSTHLGFIVFPAFLIVKMWNKIMKRHPTKTLVAHQAKATSKNILFDVAMRLEAKLLSKVYLPFGIRVLVTAYKPEY